jgi:oxygen-dependent protoporphyrinogen oxidase
LRPLDHPLATDLASIEYASSAIVTLAFRREEVPHPLDGFGFVVPHVERRRLLAGTFSSLKYPGRAPADSVLVRAFVGGALQPELLELDDEALVSVVRDELAALIGVRATPHLTRIARWQRAMPQYAVGHLERVARIRARAAALGLHLAGNAYEGVGIPDCIRSGETAAAAALGVVL